MATHTGRRAWLAVVAATVSIPAIGACGSEGDEARTASEGGGSQSTVTLATPAPESLFTFNDLIARELGFYEEEGLEVELAAVADDIPVAGFVQNGNADVGLVAATDAITAAIKSDELRIPYDERTGGNGFILGVVVPEDGDIDSAEDLAGKNIGLASPDQDRAYLASVLEAVGLSLDDVQTTVVGPGGPSVAQSLESGRIAAYTGTLNDFFAFEEAGLSVKDVTPDGLESLPVGGYIVAADELADGDRLARFFRALAKGTYVGIERPDVAEAVAREVAPEEWREPDLARGLLEGLAETLLPFDGETFGEVRPDRWERAQELLLETGVIEESVDIDELLTDEIIAEANDFDRKAVLKQADAWLTEHGGR